jgi:hypothetical protein
MPRTAASNPKPSRRGAPGGAIRLPHAWRPHPWQQRVIDAYRAGKKRFLLVVHRRAGKDQIGLNLAAIAANMPAPLGRVGLYYHVFPTEKSNRGAIWKGQDKLDGRRYIDQAFPEQLRAATRDHTMEIEFSNGSFWRCIGSDNYNALRGGNPLGVVFSEYAFADPQSWTSIIAPILRENGGWAAFISTPNGKNHFWDLYNVAAANPDVWHVEYLTVDDTVNADGKPLMTSADIEAARNEDGLTDADVRREFYCDWSAVFTGAYYGKEVHLMTTQKRVTRVDYDPKRPVFAAWDLGTSDELVCGFFQKNSAAHYCIGSRSWTFTKFEDALQDCAIAFPWKVAKHVVPHDAASGTMRDLLVTALEKYGEVEILERGPVQIGIEAVRSLLPTMWIDNEPRPWSTVDGKPHPNNQRLVEALAGYRTSQSMQQKQRGVYAATPLHSWESHFADMLRYYATAVQTGALSLTEWGQAPSYAQQDRAVV